MPGAATITAFQGQTPPWSLVSLDANFTAMNALLKDVGNYSTYIADAGGANAYSCTYGASLTFSLSTGVAVKFKAANANTGASTLNVNATGIKNILNVDGSALTANQIVAGGIYDAVYDGTQYLLINPTQGVINRNSVITGTLNVSSTGTFGSTVAIAGAGGTVPSLKLTSGAYVAPGGNGEGYAYGISTAGLVLYGQGSSTDLTIINKAAVTVMQIPTGTANVALPNGNLKVGAGSGATLGASGCIDLTADIGMTSTNGIIVGSTRIINFTANGIGVGPAGTTAAAGQCVRIDSTTASSTGVYSTMRATSGTNYGGDFESSGAATTNVGLYVAAVNATNNRAIEFGPVTGALVAYCPASVADAQGAYIRFSNMFVGYESSAGGTVMTGGLSNATVIGSYAAKALQFGISNAEAGRFSTDAYFKASNTGSYRSSTSYHELRTNVAAGSCVVVSNTHATNPDNTIYIEHTSDNNDTGHRFWSCVGSATLRAEMRSNGGLANFSANNVNLCSLSVKKDFTPLADVPGMLDRMWEAHRELDWAQYRYKDQTHEEFNYGPSAERVHELFTARGIPLTDAWQPEVERVHAGALTIGGLSYDYKVTRREENADSPLGITGDFAYVTGAMVSYAQKRIERIEAALVKAKLL